MCPWNGGLWIVWTGLNILALRKSMGILPLTSAGSGFHTWRFVRTAGHWAEPSFSFWESLTPSSQAGRRFSTWLHLRILVKGIAFGTSVFVTYLNKHANWKHALARASAASASSRSLVTDLELKLIGKVALRWGSVMLKWNQLGREMRNFIRTCHSDVWTQLVWSTKVRSLSLSTDQ